MMLKEYSCVFLHATFLSMRALKGKGISLWQLVKIFHNFLARKTPSLNFSLHIQFMLATSDTLVPLSEYLSWWLTSGLFKRARAQLKGNGVLRATMRTIYTITVENSRNLSISKTVFLKFLVRNITKFWY